MIKQIIKLLSVLVISTSLLINWTNPIKAQDDANLSDSVVMRDLNTAALVDDPNIVTWSMLGLDERNLIGPVDSVYLSFNLPADWKLTEGASLSLSLGVSVSTEAQTGSVPTDTGQEQPSTKGILGAGTLTVTINDSILMTMPVDQVGEVVKSIPIPLNTLTPTTKDGLVELVITLNSGASCYNFDQMNIAIRTSSYFTLPHDSVQPAINLVNFPRPIYQDSFIPGSALLVVPDQPSASELQAALTIAAGLGKLTGGSLTTDMVTLGKLTAEQRAANHLIFVGKPASLPVLAQFKLPLPVTGGQFQISGGGIDDGILEMVNSPWNNANVIFVVSGNTDQGTIKAAQAASTGIIQTNNSANLAIIQEVQTTSVLTPQPTDQTLTALGYEGRLFEGRGVSSVAYNFNVPPGWSVGADARFELVFGHSALLDYAGSGIVVVLNGKPIGSVRLSDASANNSANKALINIPSSAVIPGKNRLELRANLVAQDICAPRSMRGLWINVWPDSTLHLPLDLSVIDPVSSLNLASYPAPYIYYPLLDNTAFVLMNNDLESWRTAKTLATILGTDANGSITTLKVFYGDDLPEAERSKYNFLVIGQPSQMPIMSEINQSLPIPILEGSDIPTEGNFQVTYRIPPDSALGYIEILPSPWNSENVVLTILGNTTQGVGWAASSLIVPELKSKLAGNFALVVDQQIVTTDTRLSPPIQPEATPVAEVVVVQPNTNINNPPVAEQTNWVLPVFVTSIILILLVSGFVVISSWSRYRTRGVQRSTNQPAAQGDSGSNNKWLANFFRKPKNRKKDQ